MAPLPVGSGWVNVRSAAAATAAAAGCCLALLTQAAPSPPPPPPCSSSPDGDDASCPSAGAASASAPAAFRIVKREAGTEREDLPIFTNKPWGLRLDKSDRLPVWREDVLGLPGGFMLHNVASREECEQIIKMSEEMGYTEDAPVSLGRHIRHNENCVWIADPAAAQTLFERCEPFLPPEIDGGAPVGLNMRWRLYKYGPSDIFRAHTDGSWPGSGVQNSTGELMEDLFGDRWSQMSWVLYLNDNFVGGSTKFYVRSGGQSTVVDVPAKRGSVLLWFHGDHPLSHVHEGALVTEGTKYIIRSDVLYTLKPKVESMQLAWQQYYGKK